jgi:hypothetical protein
VVLPGQRLSGEGGPRPDDAAFGESCESMLELVEVGEIATAAFCFACGEPRSSVRRCDYLASALRCLAIVDKAEHKMPKRSVTMTNGGANAMHKTPGEGDITRSFGSLARYTIGGDELAHRGPPYQWSLKVDLSERRAVVQETMDAGCRMGGARLQRALERATVILAPNPAGCGSVGQGSQGHRRAWRGVNYE